MHMDLYCRLIWEDQSINISMEVLFLDLICKPEFRFINEYIGKEKTHSL